MSKKRTSIESSHDEQTDKDSDGELFPVIAFLDDDDDDDDDDDEDDTKRAKLSDTTLEDLPMELIVNILVKAVAMEVKRMQLDKSVRKENAEMVISRLRTVSLKWSSILSTDFFRNELHRTLDGFAQETMSLNLKISLQPASELFAIDMTTMGDEVFMLRGRHGEGYALDVYGRNDMVKPKDVIALPEINPNHSRIAACRVSNCVYLLNVNSLGPSVYRIAKDEHQFKVSLWIKTLRLSMTDTSSMYTGLSVSANGNLVICSGLPSPKLTVVGIYGANGVVQHKIRLSPATYGFRYVSSVIQKADGNLLLVSSDNTSEAKLLEIDTSGSIIRQYQSEYVGARVQCFEDVYGRILLYCSEERLELLDSEFNILDIAVPCPESLDDEEPVYLYNVQYNSEMHAMVAVRCDWDTNTSVFVTIYFKVPVIV